MSRKAVLEHPAPKEAEELLHEMQERLQLALRGARIAFWDRDLRSERVYFSPEWKQQIGYEEDEIGETVDEWSSRLHPEDRDRVLQEAHAYLERPQGELELEFRLRHKDGSYRWILGRTSILTLAGGKAYRVFGVHVDITERKQAEQKLRESQAMLAKAQEIAQIGSWEWDLATNKLRWSDEMLRIVGIKREEFDGSLQTALQGRVHPDDRARLRAATERALATKVPQPLEYRVVHPDGMERLVWADGEFIFDRDGKAVRMVGTIEDITERKGVERALQESEARFRSAFHDAVIGMAVSLPDGPFAQVNRAFCAMLGYSEEELRSMSFKEVTHPDDLESSVLAVDSVFKGSAQSLQMEKRYRHKQGHVVWGSVSASLVRDSGGAPLYFIAQIQDITERKRTEEQLQLLNRTLEQRVAERSAAAEQRARELVESQEALRGQTRILQSILNSIGDGLVVADENGKFLLFSPEAQRIIGMGSTHTEPATSSSVYGLYSADTMTPIPWQELPLARAIRGESVKAVELFVRNPKVPQGVFISVSARPLKDENGLSKGGVAILRDISERKRSEQALRESEAKFRTLAETVAAATFIFQGASFLYVNPATGTVTGYSRDELMRMQFWDVIHPDHRELVKERGLARQQGEQPPSNYEVKIRTKQGQVRWVDFTAGLIDYRGQKAVLGTAYDITKRRLAEEELRRSEERNNAMLNAIPDMMFRMTRAGKFLDFKANNPTELYARPSEFVGRTLHDVFPAEFAELCLSHVVRTLDSGVPHFFDYQLPIRGELQDYEARLVVSGEKEVLILVRNITERKRLEKQILEISDREQRRIGQDLHDGLCQHLTGTAFAAKVLEQKLAEQSLSESADAGELAALVEQAITQARNLSRGLYPVQLETDGLPQALDQLASNVEHIFSVSCVCRIDRGISVADKAVAAHLYRIAQESIHNAMKHGKARHIRIGLNSSKEAVTLSVTDDGVGIPEVIRNNQGMGLNVMKYRAQMIGATLEIRRASPGTVVSCSLRKPKGAKPEGQA